MVSAVCDIQHYLVIVVNGEPHENGKEKATDSF